MAKRARGTKDDLSKFMRKGRKKEKVQEKIIIHNLVESEIERIRQKGFLLDMKQIHENMWCVVTVLNDDEKYSIWGYGIAHTLYDALCKAYVSSMRDPKLKGIERVWKYSDQFNHDRRLFEKRLKRRKRPRLDSKAWERIKKLGL